MDSRKHDWWEYAARNGRSFGSSGGQQSNRQTRFTNDRSGQYTGTSYRQNQPNFQRGNNKDFQAYLQNQYGNQPSNAGSSRLQITQGPANQSASRSKQEKSPQRAGRDQAGRGKARSQRAYQASTEEVQDDDIDPDRSEVEDDAYYGEDGDNYGEEDPAAEAHFATAIKPARHECTKCQEVFASKNKLFAHLRGKC